MAVSRNVMVIPARKRAGNNIVDEKPKLRVAAYCRVSADSDEQTSSYEVQIEHYTEFIKRNPEWHLQVSLQMMESAVLILKSVMSLIE